MRLYVELLILIALKMLFKYDCVTSREVSKILALTPTLLILASTVLHARSMRKRYIVGNRSFLKTIG
jgi:hypothetical protein